MMKSNQSVDFALLLPLYAKKSITHGSVSRFNLKMKMKTFKKIHAHRKCVGVCLILICDLTDRPSVRPSTIICVVFEGGLSLVNSSMLSANDELNLNCL